MEFKLGTNIEVGQKIKTDRGWRKIKSMKSDGVMTSDGLVKFGKTIQGWKKK